MKSVPISARISEQDADFLASLKIDGANTPSEKIRYLISQARQQRVSVHSYSDALGRMRRLFEPGVERVNEAEYRLDSYSEPLHLFYDWLPEIVALAMTGGDELDEKSLIRLEAGIADRTLRLSEAMLRFGVTNECRCYNPQLLHDRLQSLLDLAGIISESRHNAESA